MTGPGRSPSSTWVQTTQAGSRDGRNSQSFHSALSPSATGMHSSSYVSERPSPNYFGITVGNSSNPPTSNPGPHTQKNWGSFTPSQQSLPSPTKLQLYSQESMSEGLANLLRSESASDRGRRESALQGHPSNGGQIQGTENAINWSQGYSGGSSAQYRKSTLGK